MAHIPPPGIDLIASRDPLGGYAPPAAGKRAGYSLVFVVDRKAQKVLLGTKKRGFATGIVNGFGGKLEPGEDMAAWAARETLEECGLRVTVREVGELVIRRPSEYVVIYYYLAEEWEGEVVETEEMAPFWVPIDEIPYDRMHPEARINTPQLLGPRTANERYVGFLECDDDVNLGYWMGWVPS